MGDVNMQLVREFFELQGFHTLTHWAHDTGRGTDSSVLLFVEQLQLPESQAEIDFLLRGGDVAKIKRAVVEVRAWHADRFYPSVIESNNILSHITSPAVRDLALDVFSSLDFRSILVVSEFPASFEPRERALKLLQQSGVNHVIEFPSLLQDMLFRISPNSNYGSSATLQTMRLLKRYGFIRRQQLEFSFPIEGGNHEIQ